MFIQSNLLKDEKLVEYYNSFNFILFNGSSNISEYLRIRLEKNHMIETLYQLWQLYITECMYFSVIYNCHN